MCEILYEYACSVSRRNRSRAATSHALRLRGDGRLLCLKPPYIITYTSEEQCKSLIHLNTHRTARHARCRRRAAGNAFMLYA